MEVKTLLSLLLLVGSMQIAAQRNYQLQSSDKKL